MASSLPRDAMLAQY